jgi:hypothetical protein
VGFIANLLGGLVKDISGAGYNANQAGGYYQGAYGPAEQQLINSTGSPAATTFGNLQEAALQPRFNRENQNLAAREAAMGITHSGAANSDFSQLAADQSGVLSGALAPLYSQALGQYGNLLSGGAAGQAGAQTGAYNQSLNDFYGALGAAAGAPNISSGGGGGSGGGFGGYSLGNVPTGVQENTSPTPQYGNFGNVYSGAYAP